MSFNTTILQNYSAKRKLVIDRFSLQPLTIRPLTFQRVGGLVCLDVSIASQPVSFSPLSFFPIRVFTEHPLERWVLITHIFCASRSRACRYALEGPYTTATWIFWILTDARRFWHSHLDAERPRNLVFPLVAKKYSALPSTFSSRPCRAVCLDLDRVFVMMLLPNRDSRELGCTLRVSSLSRILWRKGSTFWIETGQILLRISSKL